MQISRKKNYVGARFFVILALISWVSAGLNGQNTNLRFFQSSPGEVFLHVPLLAEHVSTRVDPDLPADVLDFSNERSGRLPLMFMLGGNLDLTRNLYVSSGIDYRRLPFRQDIRVAVDPNRSFAIERDLINEAFAIPLGVGFRGGRFSLCQGVEFVFLKERIDGQERFVFDQIDDPNSLPLLNELNLQQNDRETVVFRSPTIPVSSFRYRHIRLKSQAAFRIPVTSAVALDLAVSISIHLVDERNLEGKNNQTGLDDRYAQEDWWGDHYYIPSNAKFLEVRDYLSVRLVYTFDNRDRVLRKIGVE